MLILPSFPMPGESSPPLKRRQGEFRSLPQDEYAALHHELACRMASLHVRRSKYRYLEGTCDLPCPWSPLPSSSANSGIPIEGSRKRGRKISAELAAPDTHCLSYCAVLSWRLNTEACMKEAHAAVAAMRPAVVVTYARSHGRAIVTG